MCSVFTRLLTRVVCFYRSLADRCLRRAGFPHNFFNPCYGPFSTVQAANRDNTSFYSVTGPSTPIHTPPQCAFHQHSSWPCLRSVSLSSRSLCSISSKATSTKLLPLCRQQCHLSLSMQRQKKQLPRLQKPSNTPSLWKTGKKR